MTVASVYERRFYDAKLNTLFRGAPASYSEKIVP
jgi:hypothetical protein